MLKTFHSPKSRAAALAACLAAGVAASGAEAATFCVGGPTACPAGATQPPDLQAALQAAKLNAGHDVVLLGAGEFKSAAGFEYFDGNAAANTVEIVGEGDSTVLRATGQSAGNGHQVLTVEAGPGSRVARLRIVVPDGLTDADQTTGLRTVDGVAAEELRVEDAGTTGAKAAGTGVHLSGSGGLSRSVVQMSADAAAIRVSGDDVTTLADVRAHGRYGLRTSAGSTAVVRRGVLRSPWRGAATSGGAVLLESTLVEVTGVAGVALSASNQLTNGGIVKGSHLTLIGGGRDNTVAVAGEAEAAAQTAMSIDNSIIRGFERGVSRKAPDPQGSVVVSLAHVDYLPTNDFSDGAGSIDHVAVGYQKVGFVDADAGDYRLQPGSALVDAGRSASFVSLAGKDLAGSPRQVGEARDLGAYETLQRSPVAVISGVLQTQPGSPVALGGGGSNDEDAGDAIVSHHWSFGDGTEAVGSDVEHAWSAPGTYEVELTVTDTTGRTGTATALMTVTAPDVAPVDPEGPGPVVTPQPPVVDPVTGLVDRTAPALTGLRRRGQTVTLRLSEPSALVVRLERRVGRRHRALGGARRFSGVAGPNTLRRAVRRLGPGRYRLTVSATDASGNRAVKRLAFRVR